MNHLPFEDWLLNDMPMTIEQQRELEVHLRNCTYCSALAETGRLLNTPRMVAPAAGFTMRFQSRLAEHKIEERRRRLLGSLIFLVGGMILLMWIFGPWLAAFMASPATWVSTFVGWVIFLATTLFALWDAAGVILGVLPGFLSPFAWMVLLSLIAGMGLLWSVSIWRFVRVPQGV